MPGLKNAQAAPAFPPQLVPMPRVKVFRLNDQGGWDDSGTGHVTIDYLQSSTSTHDIVLAVIDEENNEPMLLHVITPDDIYRKQEETFIKWCDPEAGMTLCLCLSFQDAAGCSNIWDTISQVQRTQRPGLRHAIDTNAPRG